MKLFPMLAAASVVGVAVGLLLSADRLAMPFGRPGRDAQGRGTTTMTTEEAAYREVLAKRAIQENCLICHEAGMYTNQRLTPAQWKAEVEKMVSWGAPLPPEDHQAVIEHLAKSYRDVDPAVPPARVDLAAVDSLEIPKPDAGARPDAGDPAAGSGLVQDQLRELPRPRRPWGATWRAEPGRPRRR